MRNALTTTISLSEARERFAAARRLVEEARLAGDSEGLELLQAEARAAHIELANIWDAAKSRRKAKREKKAITSRRSGIKKSLDYRLDFGMHRGLTLGQVARQDSGYLGWLVREFERGEVKHHARVVFDFLMASQPEVFGRRPKPWAKRK